MEQCGVDVAAAIRSSFIADIANRLLVCQFSPFYIPQIELLPSQTPGEVIASFFDDVSIKIRAEIVQGNLRIYYDLLEAPPWIQEKLGDLLNKSPIEFVLDELYTYVHPLQIGLKVGGENNDLLLIGLEFAEGDNADWNRFNNQFSGNDLVENADWGLYAERPFIKALIHKVTDFMLAHSDEADLADLSNLEITHIEWPGNWIRLKGTATYTGCSTFREIDLRWKSALTFPREEAKLFAKLRFYEVNPRGEEDAIEAWLCTLSWQDFLGGLFTGFASLLVNILRKAFSSTDDQILQKELVELVRPEFGILRPNNPQISTDGILFYGRAPLETGSSRLDIDENLFLEKSITTPFYCIRPNTTITEKLVISNTGHATLTICGAAIETETTTPDVGGRFSVTGDFPLLILPQTESNLQISFSPSFSAQFGNEYTATLLLKTIKKSVNAAGIASTSFEEKRVNLTAKYSCNHYDGEFVEPDFGIGYDDEHLLIEAWLEQLFVDMEPRLPWMDTSLPAGTVSDLGLICQDPLVSSMKVINSAEEVVAHVESLDEVIYLDVGLEPDQSYHLLLSGNDLRKTKTADKGKTVVESNKRHFIPAAVLNFKDPVNHAELHGSTLYLASANRLIAVLIEDPAHPTMVPIKNFPKEINSFALVVGKRNIEKKPIVISLDSRHITVAELNHISSTKLKLYPVRKNAHKITDTFISKVIIYKSIYLVYGDNTFILSSINDNNGSAQLNQVTLKEKIHDAVFYQDTLFFTTSKGILIYSIKNSAFPEYLGMFETETPVSKLVRRGFYLYVLQGEKTLILDCKNPAKLKNLGFYNKPHLNFWISWEEDIAFSVSESRKQVQFYHCVQAKADIKKLAKFALDKKDHFAH